jgi:exosome complex RNA-binding protein Rrp4
MSKLKFSDGMEFDLSGPLRVELRSDGYYVVGNGMLMAVDTFEKGQEYILRNKNLLTKIKSEINK